MGKGACASESERAEAWARRVTRESERASGTNRQQAKRERGRETVAGRRGRR